MPVISLSYIVATYNRLLFLRVTLEKLINALQQDEEIVVVDGGSTDGSKEYLQQLFADGKIQQFISEPDRNQAHAWNKAMMMARGTIIKKIIDDDVFCYEAIRECKNYMLQKPEVDIVISNCLESSLTNYKSIQNSGRLRQFEKWKNGQQPSFTFTDVHMLVRKDSLSYIGLYNTGMAMMDWEYSLRASYLKANIVYYTGYNALSVAHHQTVTSFRNDKLIKLQGERIRGLYQYDGDQAEISKWSKIKIYFGKLLKSGSVKSDAGKELTASEINAAYTYYYQHISDINRSNGFEFLKKD